MTQAQLAKKAGMSQPTLNKLERGGSYSTKRLVAIAEATGFSAHWLDTGRGNPRPPPVASHIKEFSELSEEMQEQTLKIARALQQ